MRSFTVDERRARLAHRHLLVEPGAPAIPDVARRFVGLHATDPATPHLSLWARIPGFRVADLDTAVYENRTVVKHLAMRRTLWLVATDDLATVQSAASDRVAATERKKLVTDVVTSGIATDGAAWLDTASAAVLAHLAEQGPASARQLREALPQLAGDHDPAPGKPYGGAGPISPRVLTVLGVQGRIVRGPNDGAWTSSRPRWTATAQWLGTDPEPVDPEAARATLIRTWLETFGPATIGDVKWWFGHTLTWARAGLAEVGAVEVDLHGSPGFALPDDLEPEPPAGHWVALLPSLDVTTMGWQDRDWYLGRHRAQIFDRNGNAGPTAWCDGRIVGAWAQDGDGRVVLRLVETIGKSASKALTRKASELTEWLDGVRVSPRFPSPLSKSVPSD